MRPFHKVLVCSLVGLLLASCTKTMQTAVVVKDPQGRISQHPLVADLDVQERAELTLSRNDLRNAAGNKKEYLAAELLKQTGGDVLLEARVFGLDRSPYEWPDSVVVSGYPATYARFRNATKEELEQFILPADGGQCDCNRIWSNESSAKVDTFQLDTVVDHFEKTVFKPSFHVDAGFLVPALGMEITCLYDWTPHVGFDVLKVRCASQNGKEGKPEVELAIGTGIRFYTPRTRGGQRLFCSADLMYEKVTSRDVIAGDFTAGLYLAKPVYVAYRLNVRSNPHGCLKSSTTHWVKLGLTF